MSMRLPTRTVSPVQLRTIGTGSLLAAMGGLLVTQTTGAWPAAKRVIYQPFRVPEVLTVRQLWIDNGGTVSGNVDVGIYTRDGVKLVASGSTAQAGINAPQLFDIADTQLGVGVFYLALTLDNATGVLTESALPTAVLQMLGIKTETTGSFGLPATATFGDPADAYLPYGGVDMAAAL